MRDRGRIRKGERAAADPWQGLAAGVVGGLAGSLTMAVAQGLWAAATGMRVEAGHHDVAGDVGPGGIGDGYAVAGATEASTSLAVRSLARGALGWELSTAEVGPAGRAFHVAFGTALGGVYGVMAEYAPWATAGLGLPFTAVQMLAADELAVPALGLSGPPGRAPAAAHAYSLAIRMVYGLTLELTRRGIRRPR